MYNFSTLLSYHASKCSLFSARGSFDKHGFYGLVNAVPLPLLRYSPLVHCAFIHMSIICFHGTGWRVLTCLRSRSKRCFTLEPFWIFLRERQTLALSTYLSRLWSTPGSSILAIDMIGNPVIRSGSDNTQSDWKTTMRRLIRLARVSGFAIIIALRFSSSFDRCLLISDGTFLKGIATFHFWALIFVDG